MSSGKKVSLVLASLMLPAFAAIPQFAYSYDDQPSRSSAELTQKTDEIMQVDASRFPVLSDLVEPVFSTLAGSVAGDALLDDYFDISAGNYVYDDDVFRGTATPYYSRGHYVKDSQCHSSGCLKVSFGGRDDDDILGMSGGWTTSFNLPETSDVSLSIRYRIRQLEDYEADEYTDALISLDGALVDFAGNEYLGRVRGDGTGGGNIDTGWRIATMNLGTVSAGSHSLTVGGYNNKKTARLEYSSVWFDFIRLQAEPNDSGSGGTPVVPEPPGDDSDEEIRFGVLGDFGTGEEEQADVSRQMDNWNLDFIVTVGDNRYGDRTMDRVIGQFYCPFLADVNGGTYCPSGESSTNAFFPVTGNHDYGDGGGIDEYLDYFDLPGANVLSTGSSGTELYYDFIQGPVHFFALDSEGSDRSEQQDWLQRGLEASTSPWKVVVLHHPPYSSSSHHGSDARWQWPYSEWGADVVMAGHDHMYERIEKDGVLYFVNGLGGRPVYQFAIPVEGSRKRYNGDNGAQRVTATPTRMTFEFITRTGSVVESHSITQ